MEPSEYTPLPREAHEYIDGLLGAEAEREFEKRLARDASLKQRIAEVQAARRMLQSVALMEPPASFDKGVFERIKYVDLAADARARIISTSGSWWQRGVLAAAGALAASVAIAVVGLPGANAPAPENSPARIGGDVALVSINESDVMPLFADQYDRFRELQRQVLNAPLENSDAQRDLVRGELELSDIAPRCKRLDPMIQGLAGAERREYVRFFETLAACCEGIDSELVKSQTERRAPNRQTFAAHLAGVYVPTRLSRESGMLVTRFGPSSRSEKTARVAIGNDAELALYLSAREAFYARDYALAARNYESYLARHAKGRFAGCAKAGSATSLMRAGYTDAALDRYLADVKGSEKLLSLMDATDLALFRQAEAERARRKPAPPAMEER